MARIRSVHPGLWTDERFVSVSPMARLFFIGLWTECDDEGCFPWSPLKLKMRILPADGADAGQMLGELLAAGMIGQFEVEGQAIGAVRNFRRFQKPERPSPGMAKTDEVREFVALSSKTSPGSAKSFPGFGDGSPNDHRTLTEGSPKVGADGEGEGDKGKRPTSASQPYREPGRTDQDLEAVLRSAAGLENDPAPGLHIVGPVHALIGEGYDLEKHVLPVVRALKAAGKRWRSWGYVVDAVRERNAVPKANHPPPSPPDPAKERRGQEAMARGFLSEGRWSDAWGPRPGEPGCKIPDEMIIRVAREVGVQWPAKGKRAA